MPTQLNTPVCCHKTVTPLKPNTPRTFLKNIKTQLNGASCLLRAHRARSIVVTHRTLYAMRRTYPVYFIYTLPRRGVPIQHAMDKPAPHQLELITRKDACLTMKIMLPFPRFIMDNIKDWMNLGGITIRYPIIHCNAPFFYPLIPRINKIIHFI